jgi:hypothetical protein
MIRATIGSDDGEVAAGFDAQGWFEEQMPPYKIMRLAESGWYASDTADEIAWWRAAGGAHSGLAVRDVLDYCEAHDVGFVVQVDRDEAMRWLTVHLPLVARLIERKGW